MNEHELKAYEIQAQTSFMLGYIWSRLNIIKYKIHPRDKVLIDDLLEEITPKMNKIYYSDITQQQRQPE